MRLMAKRFHRNDRSSHFEGGCCQATDRIAEEPEYLQDVPAYDMDDGTLSPEDINHIREVAAPMLPKGKLLSVRSVYPEPPRTPEEQTWLDMVPVGREFGSKDYDRLMEMDLRSEGMDEKK